MSKWEHGRDSCDECHYAAPTHNGMVECRRHAPGVQQVALGYIHAHYSFPVLLPYDWCGDWRRAADTSSGAT